MNTARTILLGGVLGIALAGCIGWASAGNDELPETEIDPVSYTEIVEVIEDQIAETTEQLEDLPACLTEDSEGCYWDADTQGNEEGNDIVTIPAEDEVIEEQEEWPGMDQGELICGPEAMPAIDYNEEWGWWAYCEPALVE